MSFKKQAEQILLDLIQEVSSIRAGKTFTPTDYSGPALTSIINLVDKDIIGENFKHQNGQPMKNPAYECPECGEPNVEYTVNVCKNSMRAKLRDGE